MDKRILSILIIIIGLFMANPVYAEEDGIVCPLDVKTALREDAASVSVTYVPVEEVLPNTGDEETEPVIQYFFNVKIFNINSKLKAIVKINDENYDEITGTTVTYKNIGKDGSITLKKRANRELTNLIIEIRAADNLTSCNNEVLRTMKLTLPKYNDLSERELCVTYPEFYMCQKYVHYDIDSSKFSQEIYKYIEKKEKEDNASNVDVEDNNTVVSKVANLISKNKFIVVGLIIVAGVVATIIILKRKKSVL